MLIKNLLDDNNKLKSDERLGEQPELVELKKIKLELEFTKKALEESKKAETKYANQADTYRKHVDIVNKHLGIFDTNLKIQCKFQNKQQGCKFGLTCKYEHSEMGGKPDCPFWLENRCKFSSKKCKGVHDQNRKGSNVNAAKEMEQQRGLGDKLDCSFWMENRCKFGKKCRAKHEPNKRGSKVT